MFRRIQRKMISWIKLYSSQKAICLKSSRKVLFVKRKAIRCVTFVAEEVPPTHDYCAKNSRVSTFKSPHTADMVVHCWWGHTKCVNLRLQNLTVTPSIVSFLAFRSIKRKGRVLLLSLPSNTSWPFESWSSTVSVGCWQAGWTRSDHHNFTAAKCSWTVNPPLP